MKDMVAETGKFTPKPLLQSRTMDRPPVIPGSGTGFRTPDRQPGKRNKSHKLRNTALITGALGVAGGGVYLATQDGNESSNTNTPVVTTVDVTQPPLTSPETTVITSPATTIETPTTVVERVFASPEQQEQVEAVEANMANFFELTPNDLELYKNQATFTPYPDGFAPVRGLIDGTVPSFGVLAINLGTMVSIGDNGQTAVHFFGVMKEDGTRYVASEILVITDPEIANGQFSYFAGGSDVNVMKPAKEPNEYGTTSAFDLDTLLDRTITMAEAISVLDSNPGQPMTLEVSADSAWLVSAWDFPTVANPEMKQIFEEIFELGSGDRIQSALSKYSDEQLAAIGIFKSVKHIPQEMLSYTSAAQITSRYPLSHGFTLFSAAPPVTNNT